MFSPEVLVGSGLFLIWFILFAETGLLIGFMLPGDSLLFTAGIFAAQGKLPIVSLILGMIVAAIAGNAVGYYIGKHAGPRLFRKKDGIFFRHEHIEKSQKFFEKHGGKAIILARFVPIARTFAPVVAGVGNMDFRRFMIYNIVSAPIWVVSITLLGYFVGDKIPHIEVLAMLVVVIAISITIIGPLVHALRDEKLRNQLIANIRSIVKR